jgi:hypothetical protein
MALSEQIIGNVAKIVNNDIDLKDKTLWKQYKLKYTELTS